MMTSTESVVLRAELHSSIRIYIYIHTYLHLCSTAWQSVPFFTTSYKTNQKGFISHCFGEERLPHGFPDTISWDCNGENALKHVTFTLQFATGIKH